MKRIEYRTDKTAVPSKFEAVAVSLDHGIEFVTRCEVVEDPS